jgi:hypothetical protein
MGHTPDTVPCELSGVLGLSVIEVALIGSVEEGRCGGACAERSPFLLKFSIFAGAVRYVKVCVWGLGGEGGDCIIFRW